MIVLFILYFIALFGYVVTTHTIVSDRSYLTVCDRYGERFDDAGSCDEREEILTAFVNFVESRRYIWRP